jgi:hypothetical protein
MVNGFYFIVTNDMNIIFGKAEGLVLLRTRLSKLLS